MLGLTTLGTFHTALSLIALAAGFVALARGLRRATLAIGGAQARSA